MADEPKRKVFVKFWEHAVERTEAEIRELLDGGLLTAEQAAQERQGPTAAAPASRPPAQTPPADTKKEQA